MQIEVVETNKIYSVTIWIVYFTMLVAIGLILIPNVLYADAIFKILFVLLVAIGLTRLAFSSFKVIGIFCLEEDHLKFVIEGKCTETSVDGIERMVVHINSYVGKPVGFTLRTHHGSDNKVKAIIGGKEFSFLFRLDSRSDRDVFEKRINHWASINNNIVIRKAII